MLSETLFGENGLFLKKISDFDIQHFLSMFLLILLTQGFLHKSNKKINLSRVKIGNTSLYCFITWKKEYLKTNIIYLHMNILWHFT